MRPTLLKPGDQVKCNGRVMTFIRREKQPCRSALNWFQCDDYRGLNGPDDDGRCVMNDYRVSRQVERLAQQPGSEARHAV